MVWSCSSWLANWLKKSKYKCSWVTSQLQCKRKLQVVGWAWCPPLALLPETFFNKCLILQNESLHPDTVTHCFLNILYCYSVTPEWLKRFLTGKLLPPTLPTSCPNQFGTIWNWPFFLHFQLKMILTGVLTQTLTSFHFFHPRSAGLQYKSNEELEPSSCQDMSAGCFSVMIYNVFVPSSPLLNWSKTFRKSHQSVWSLSVKLGWSFKVSQNLSLSCSVNFTLILVLLPSNSADCCVVSAGRFQII